MSNGELGDLPELKHPFVELTPATIEVIATALELLGSYEKVHKWLVEKEPLLGYIAPLRLIQIGRGRKVLELLWDIDRGNLP